MKFLLALLFLVTPLIGYPHPSVSIVMDSKGNVYYSDLKQVWQINAQGKKSIVVPNVHTHELYLDKEDNLYGEHLWYNGESANTWGHYVWMLSSDGTIDRIKPSTGGFLNDYSFVHDGRGRMYWADRENSCQRLNRKNKDGSVTKLGDQCLNNIRWVTSTPDGTVYLMDLFDVKKIDQNGHVTTLAGPLQKKGKDQNSIMGISVDALENLYVAVYSEHKVKKVTQSGIVSVVAETSMLWSPSGTLVAPNGDFWILECTITNAVRVERITVQGRRIIY